MNIADCRPNSRNYYGRRCRERRRRAPPPVDDFRYRFDRIDFDKTNSDGVNFDEILDVRELFLPGNRFDRIDFDDIN